MPSLELETAINLDKHSTYKATGNINVEATGNLTMKGAMVSIQAQATGEVKASGPLTLKGAIVNIN